MTNSSSSVLDSTTPTASRSDLPRRVTALAALVGGAALVVDTVTITVINSNFGVLDDITFFVGLIGLVATAVGLALFLTCRSAGARRGLLGVAVFVGTVAILGGLSAAADAFGRHTFSKANVGLHGEWSFFSIGVALLVIAAITARRG